ncbi:MAG TPA: glycosyl hydrolase family 65 protein [Thermoanaerobaculia bacterium]|nr:glycosyl hydrolase family 65 protein [Thermoanaerobaculia bacterium]
MTAYGHFSNDGIEYVITNPRPPRPWINLIANPRIGLTVSQTGSGFSWIDNSQLAVLVRWQQELTEDRSGRFLYLWDRDADEVWSLAPAPCWPAYDRYACRHGLGATTFETEHRGVRACWTLSVDSEETVELWRVRLEDMEGRARRLSVIAYLEWNCGVSPAPRREFQKLFLETAYDAAQGLILAGSHMWELPSPRWGHWNRSFPYWSAFAAATPISMAEGDKAAFLGRNGDWSRPAALCRGAHWPTLFGRHHDPVAALCCDVDLAAGGAHDLGFTLATAEDRDEASALARRFTAPETMDASLAVTAAGWRDRLAAHRIETPDPLLDALANDWLRYQAISARLWGRAGYYQQSGAYGFRDQLQDSQVWLTIEPPRCRDQIALHAAHQFADGSVYHWWHPLSEQGHVTRMTDDLLWLAFVTANYLKETGDLSILDDRAPYLDDPEPHPLLDHVERAFARAFARTGPRGLPYIGGGDWNDGLSALGLEERGESVWLAQFLAGLLADWSEIHRRLGKPQRAGELAARRQALLEAINEHAWDGGWYRRATRDDGTWIGSAENEAGRIFLNAQTWAILNDVAPPERAAACLSAVKEHLVSPAGALLLAPAYSVPDETVGYITRYAPGLRENGGVYTHAATWVIAAAAKMRDADLVGRLLTAIHPANKDPERYWAEPYVLPGNVDGPDSPYHGRAGWTWYTGSAAWLPRIISEWVLGVRPTWEGLRFDPCLPPKWTRAALRRPWRGARLHVEIERVAGLAQGEVEVTVDDQPLAEGVLGDVRAGAEVRVGVRCG